MVNTHMHGLSGSKVESESFTHDFRLPKCYDIPKAKLRDITSHADNSDEFLVGQSSNGVPAF